MKVIGLGIDLVDIAQLEDRLSNLSFLHRVFTDAEIKIAIDRRKSTECLAGKFAIKEAVMKCLGAGIQQGIWFTQIEVLNETTGAPFIKLYKQAEQLASELGVTQWQVSLSHTAHTAGAVVLALGND